LLDDCLGRESLSEQLEGLRAVADVHNRLRRGNSDVRIGPQHPVADGEHARLHRTADFTALRVETENRKRAGVPQRFGEEAARRHHQRRQKSCEQRAAREGPRDFRVDHSHSGRYR
jgi:hypothetical protein